MSEIRPATDEQVSEMRRRLEMPGERHVLVAGYNFVFWDDGERPLRAWRSGVLALHHEGNQRYSSTDPWRTQYVDKDVLGLIARFRQEQARLAAAEDLLREARSSLGSVARCPKKDLVCAACRDVLAWQRHRIDAFLNDTGSGPGNRKTDEGLSVGTRPSGESPVPRNDGENNAIPDAGSPAPGADHSHQPKE